MLCGRAIGFDEPRLRGCGRQVFLREAVGGRRRGGRSRELRTVTTTRMARGSSGEDSWGWLEGRQWRRRYQRSAFGKRRCGDDHFDWRQRRWVEARFRVWQRWARGIALRDWRKRRLQNGFAGR
jgi:hypothetical protein